MPFGSQSGGQKGVVDALTNTYTEVAKMMLLPDAGQHMKFLQGIQQAIMSYIQMQARASLGPPAGQGQPGAAGMGGMGGGMGMPQQGPPPGMGGGMPGPGGGAPPGPPGGMPPGLGPQRIAPGGGAGMGGLMTQPNPDELRQLLGAGGQ